MARPGRSARLERTLLGVLSVALVIGVYWAGAAQYRRPEILPPPPLVVAVAASLVSGEHRGHEDGVHHHAADQVSELIRENARLPKALGVSTLRVLFGIGVGGGLGVGVGLIMGGSRRVDEYLHPLYVLLRSVPPLALITYVMLWLGHGEAHLLVPIAYAVLMTVVIPTYHGVRDVAEIHVQAARALGAGPRLLLTRVVLPASSPFVLSGLRYAVIIAWMTTVGVEMLMSDNGIGHLLVGGGLWSSRLEVRVDPSIVFVGILTVAAAGLVMDSVVRVIGARFTAWAPRATRW